MERLDRGSRSKVLPLFLSVSLRKHLHDGVLDYGGQLNREMEKALTSAKLESLQRHESVAIVPCHMEFENGWWQEEGKV